MLLQEDELEDEDESKDEDEEDTSEYMLLKGQNR